MIQNCNYDTYIFIIFIFCKIMAFLDTLGSFLPFGGSLISSISQIFTNKANRDFQREMWNEQKEYNTSERIAAQEYNTGERLAAQDYNSPVNQYARLMATGINPNAAMQSITGVASNPQSISAQSASPSFTDQVNPLGSMADIALVAAQSKKLEAEAKGQQIENDYKDESLSLSIKQQKKAISLADAQIENTKSSSKITDAQTEQIKQLTPLLVTKTKQEIQDYEEIWKKYSAEISLMKQQEKVAMQDSKVKGEEYKREVWKNTCRAAGFDPDSDALSNILRIALAEPDKASEMITSLFSAVKSALGSVITNGISTLDELSSSEVGRYAKGSVKYPSLFLPRMFFGIGNNLYHKLGF